MPDKPTCCLARIPTLRTGNRNNGQATQIEFTIGADIVGTRLDFYDISLVNAYNLPVQVRPLNPPMVR